MIVNVPDDTGAIAEMASARHPWVQVVHREDRGERKVGGGVIKAFYAGFEKLRTTDYDFICKIDADVTFPESYFEGIMKKMEEDPRER